MASQDGLFDSTVTLPGDETSFPDSQDAPNPNQEHAALTVLRILNHTLSQDIPHLPIDYKLRREQDTPRPHALGQGTFCDVFTHVVKGHEALSVPNVQRGDIVALKRPPQPRDPSSAALKNCLTGIQREIDLALHPSLRCHRNICRLLYIGWEAKSLIPILAFPTATYGTLEDFLCGSSKGRGTVEAAVRAVLTSDIACGLLALHDHGFVHRDLKTTNILVDECPVNKVPAVLTNFSGSIRQSLGSSTADDGHGHITPKWAAPEELAGEPIDQYSRCDVYSFGLVIVTLWMAGYTQPDRSFPLLLSSLAAKAETDSRQCGKRGIKDVRCLQDDREYSPLQLATNMFEPDSIPARVIRLTLRCEPLERVQMQRIVQELQISTFDDTVDKEEYV